MTRRIPANGSCTRGSGNDRCAARALRSRRRTRPARRGARRRVSGSLDDRPAARFVQHRRAERRLHVAAAPRRTSRHLARRCRALRRRRRRAGTRDVAARIGGRCRCTSTHGLRAGLVFTTLPLQRRDRHQRADDRRDGSQIRNRRVQGRSRAHRQARELDLHFTSATASADERAAIDACLACEETTDMPRASATRCSRCCTRCTIELVGSVRAASNYAGERLGGPLRPTSMASRPSTRSSRRRRVPARSLTSATTSPAYAPAPRSFVRRSKRRPDRPA